MNQKWKHMEFDPHTRSSVLYQGLKPFDRYFSLGHLHEFLTMNVKSTLYWFVGQLAAHHMLKG